MWFLFQQPDVFLDRFKAVRERSERSAQLTRALRGSTPSFDAPAQRRLTAAMARSEQPCGGRLAAERS
jgi:hypothetical protein